MLFRSPVLVETVGVGQDEVDVARVADVTVVVLVPGMGDEVQAMKAGIMEVADIFVINKADHPGVERLEQTLHGLLPPEQQSDEWIPPIVKTIATDGTGLDELKTQIDACLNHARGNPKHAAKRRDAAGLQLAALVRDRLAQQTFDRAFPGEALAEIGRAHV